MEYTIKQLADMAGVSPRTIRFYDEIKLLKPGKINSSGYRIYGSKEVDRLQQILFFREMGVNLTEISNIIDSPSFNMISTLKEHLTGLENKADQIGKLIINVRKTILKEEGKETMADKEKFEGFKKDIIKENESRYGQEIREKYGDKEMDESNARIMGLSQEEYKTMQELSGEIIRRLENAVKENISPTETEGQEIARLHKQWLSYTWGSYSKEAHRGLVNMYVEDERFKKYYDTRVAGCAEFLKEAVEYYAE